MGFFLYVAAVILFFLAGVGSTAIPGAVTWGLFCLALGLAINCYWPSPPVRSPPS